MDICKITVLAGLVCCGVSCSSKTDEMVSKTKYDAIVAEREELKSLHQETLENNEEKTSLINSVVKELNELSGRTFELQSNVEQRTANNNLEMASQIARDLNTLKAKLASTPDKGDKKLQSIIRNLQVTILERENEIGRLREVIEDKDHQIANLGNEVDGLVSQLQQKNRELVNQEKNSWLTMGDELVEAGDLLPEVKGHGNMKPIKKAKIEIYARAIECFERAEKLGESTASRKKMEVQSKYTRAK